MSHHSSSPSSTKKEKGKAGNTAVIHNSNKTEDEAAGRRGERSAGKKKEGNVLKKKKEQRREKGGGGSKKGKKIPAQESLEPTYRRTAKQAREKTAAVQSRKVKPKVIVGEGVPTAESASFEQVRVSTSAAPVTLGEKPNPTPDERNPGEQTNTRTSV